MGRNLKKNCYFRNRTWRIKKNSYWW